MTKPVQTSFDRAEAIYKERLKDKLEPEHNGEVVVINPDTGEYCIAEDPVIAVKEFEKKFPGVRGGIIRVGQEVLYRFGTLP
ncbi:MAG: hypothetical protein HY719_10475 [Planctomycetes bacterium]|nr:hypothetical protein [Planctomycetota bacterium]